MACPSCKVRLTLHGHMWEDIQTQLAKLDSPGESNRS